MGWSFAQGPTGVFIVTKPVSVELPPLLRQAVTAHQAGRLDAAYPLYRQFVDQHPRHPTALQLFGLLHSQNGQYDAAIELMRESLRLAPQQAEVANNLGNALSRSGRPDEAIESYEQAIRLQPGYADALRNQGLCYLKTERLQKARQCFARCLELRPDDATAWLSLGNVHKERNDFEAAIDCYEKALGLNPEYADAHHNLGVCLRLKRCPREALEHYESAARLGLDRAELHHNRGSALVDVLDIGGAIDAYREALARDPLDATSHHDLNTLLWQQGEVGDDYLKSYQDALDEAPGAEELRVAYGMALNQQESFERAEQVLAEGLRHAPESSQLKSLLAYTLEGQGRWSDALELHAAAVKTVGAVPNHRISYARALLSCARPDEALRQAELGLADMPFNQRAIAYVGLCWRMLGDERDEILNDYERFVRVYDLPLPAGFSNAEEFNQQLAAVLEPLHATKEHPPEQTLRGGSQTSGDLLVRSESEIVGLAEGLRECIRDFVSRLPRDEEHPLLMRHAESFDFSASWSVRLRPCGYHTMHTHPLGWVSSAYYVQVPREVAESDAHGGGLKFGEPDIDLGAEGAARRTIQPAVGRLALFPSYMWHGTVPFESDETRMTVAFDVVPKKE